MQTWFYIVPISHRRKKRLVGLPCGRNIAKKRDFCSSYRMRVLIIAFVLFACMGQAYAISCNDFKSEFKKYRDEADQLDQQQKQLPNIRFLHCQHVQFKLAPHLERKIETFRSFADCPEGKFTKYYISETEKYLAYVKKSCD